MLESVGAEVVVSRHDPGNPDAIYAYDPALVGGEGAVLLRPGKEGRRKEPVTLASTLEEAGIPVVAEIADPAFVEGGDTLWLDEKTLLMGIGYRTNSAAIAALEAAFPGVEPPDLRPPALERHRRGAAPHVAHLSAGRRSRCGLSAARAGAPSHVLADRGIGSSRCRTRSSHRRARMFSRSARVGLWRWRATPRRGDAWSARASTSPCIAARRSRGRATAARPADSDRCCAPRRGRSRARSRGP